MTTRQTVLPKKCLKFEGYIFLPSDNEKKTLRYYASRTPGRIKVYDEFGNKIGSRDFAFDNIGAALNHLETIRRNLVMKRTKLRSR